MHNTTWKHWIIYLLIVLLVVLLARYLVLAIDLLWTFYQWAHGLLAPLFSGSGVGHIILGLLSLGAVPLCVSAVPAAGYWVLTKKQFSYFWPLVWAALLVLTTLLLGHV